MNVYDFDETIYDGDSTVDFVKYSIIHQPKVLIYFPKIAIYGLLFVLKLLKEPISNSQLTEIILENN